MAPAGSGVGVGWGAMALYREQGVVLRTYKLGEADRIVHVLTPGRGKVRCVAKGVRRTQSRLGGRMEPYSLVDLQLYEGRNLDIVTQASLLTSFNELRTDFDLSVCAAGVVEAADRIAQEDENTNRLFLLVVEALRRLAAVPTDPRAVLDAFLLRLMSTAGYHPVTSACAACGRAYVAATAIEPVGFHIAAGGLLCSRCRPPEAQRIRPGTIALLHALVTEPDWGAGLLGATELRDRRAATGLARSFYTYHVGRPLRAWDLVPQ